MSAVVAASATKQLLPRRPPAQVHEQVSAQKVGNFECRLVAVVVVVAVVAVVAVVVYDAP